MGAHVDYYIVQDVQDSLSEVALKSLVDNGRSAADTANCSAAAAEAEGWRRAACYLEARGDGGAGSCKSEGADCGANGRYHKNQRRVRKTRGDDAPGRDSRGGVDNSPAHRRACAWRGRNPCRRRRAEGRANGRRRIWGGEKEGAAGAEDRA